MIPSRTFRASLVLSAILLLPSGSAEAQKRINTVLLVASTGAIVGDCVSTYNAVVKHPELYVERNPLLGAKPTTGRLAMVCGGAIVGNFVVGHIIPKKHRKWWYIAVGAIEVAVLVHNLREN